MANPMWSFEAHGRNALVLARENLANVTLFRLETGYARVDVRNMWHLVGNLAIASCASSEKNISPVENMAEAMQGVGRDYHRSLCFFSELLTRDDLRSIFALEHIPEGAPELRQTKRSRELLVTEFIRQAHMLDPGTTVPTVHQGNGNHLFLGQYQRSLS